MLKHEGILVSFMKGNRYRADTIHLQVFGKVRVVHVKIPSGPSTLVDLLPMARALSDDLAAAAGEKARAEGREISCRSGCGACCRQMVGISAIEAQGLAELIPNLPPERRAVIERRFIAAIRRLEESGLLDRNAPKGRRRLRGLEPGQNRESARAVSKEYFNLQIPCPFLETESCSIYEERPLMCREYNVSSPAELCAHPHSSPVMKVTPPLQLGTPLAKTAAQFTGISFTILPLILSLEWAGAHGEQMKTTADGEEITQTFLSCLDPDHKTAFDHREIFPEV